MGASFNTQAYPGPDYGTQPHQQSVHYPPSHIDINAPHQFSTRHRPSTSPAYTATQQQEQQQFDPQNLKGHGQDPRGRAVDASGGPPLSDMNETLKSELEEEKQHREKAEQALDELRQLQETSNAKHEKEVASLNTRLQGM